MLHEYHCDTCYKGSGRAGARGPRPFSVKDDLRRQGHSEKKKAIPSAQVWSAEMKFVLYLAASNGDLWGLEDTII